MAAHAPPKGSHLKGMRRPSIFAYLWVEPTACLAVKSAALLVGLLASNTSPIRHFSRQNLKGIAFSTGHTAFDPHQLHTFCLASGSEGAETVNIRLSHKEGLRWNKKLKGTGWDTPAPSTCD